MQQKETVKLVVTIPAYNEAATVAEVIKSVPQQINNIDQIQVVVVNDGSSDNTEKVAAQAGAHVVSFTHNKGLGAAFSQGLKTALSLGADIIVNIDADGQFNTNDIPKLIAPIIQCHADMVTASRFADKSLVPTMPWIKKWGNFRVANIVNNLTGQKLHDVSCGFRAYSRDAALRATLLGGHTYTHEIILELAFRGLKIIEVPVEVIGVRKVGKSKVASNLFKYGWHSLVIMLRAFRDYRPMKVFGGISILFLGFAIIAGLFVCIHFIKTGAFRPYTFVAFAAAAFAFTALLSYITALLAGMINRLRILQDEQLFLLRKNEYDKKL